jgi:3-hydroxyisobutyrate dehydrogenase-like beta-hydroxyacid dehydrogenase
MSTFRKIGFIGVGTMGHGMASNLVAKGFETIVLGRTNRVPVEDLLARGATEGANPADVATRSELVLLCVADSTQVETLVYGLKGLLGVARPGMVVVDTSTSAPDSTERIFKDFAERGVTFVDAPLGRSAKEAAEGRLNIMVGAEPDVLAAIAPVLSAFSENIFHAGGPGAGHKMKLVNNFLAMGQAALIAEALVTARKVGVDVETLFRLLSVGPANSGLLQAIVPSVIAGTYDGVKFQLDIARKDLRYYTHLAEGEVIPTVLGDAVHQAFVQASALGFGAGSIGGLVRAMETLSGISVPDLTAPHSQHDEGE